MVTAQYSDGGAASGVPALTGSTRVQLQPKSKEAEHFSAQSGVTVNDRATARAGKRLGEVDHNDWVAYGPVDLRNVGSVTLGVTNGGLGGDIELRTGSPTGTLIGRATIGSTGGWDNLVSPTVTLTNKPAGTTTLYATFVNARPGRRHPGPDGTGLAALQRRRRQAGAGRDAVAGGQPTGGTVP
ncbi:carbohydrate-binding protein [Micromonospora sp. M12]